MSGSKCSSIALNRIAELLLKAKRERDTTLKKIEELTGRIDNIKSRIDEVQTEDSAISKRFAEYKELLKKETLNLEKRGRELQDTQLPDSILDINSDWLEATRRRILQIKGKSQSTGNAIDEVDLNIINLNVADKTLSNIEFNMQKFQNDVKNQEEFLKKWMHDEYSQFTQDYNTFQGKLIRCKETLRNGKDAEEVAKNFKETEGILSDLSKRLTGLAQEAYNREELHQRRLYILKGLREVCASLGFEEVSEPGYEKDGDYNSPVLQTFDTINEGPVTFRLHLHNLIESDSGINLEVCEDEFGKLSELLAHEYGVQTSFKRVGQEERPKRISKTEKPMPHPEPQKGKRGTFK
ncbi:MAG: Chromosome partition protein Smc [Candidatus Scalindua rubra]|uniref:Chromosome partition protein Smc n=1 Tax=Candidatus Scalindua rubra TaxID=1872076 RepID=A0A1E3XGH1_9BACT|nr:MAG: Chromosome partition protein Smc [Candidatus Scalindua rubra]